MSTDQIHRSFITRAIASGLAAVYLFTNVAASHATESAFWGERRRAAQARFQSTGNETSSRPLYAQLPNIIPTLPGLSAVLEHATPQTAVNLPDLGKAVAQTTDRRILDVAQAILPYGNIRFVRESKKTGAPLVLHIQDVHGNLEAQKNMAEMLSALARDHGVILAGLEGATGGFATDEFKPYPDHEAVKKVAAYFMKKDILGGPEYAALASDKPITLWGIEDPALYQANVKAVKGSLAGRTEADTILVSLSGTLDHLKQTLYTEDLKSFDKNQTLYDQGHRGLGEYVQALTKFDGQKDIVLSLKFPNVSRLLSALREEKNLDFAVVEQDRKALVEKLVEKLTQAELQELVRRSVDLRGGKTSHNAYNGYLRSLCDRNGLSLSRYPSLTAYMHYVAASEDIDREDLLKEMGSLETAAQDTLIKTAEQRKLVDLSRDASRLKKLLSNEMTPDDWTAYKARQAEITSLPVRVKEMDPNLTVRWPESMSQFLSPFESFCARAMDRNGALTGRLLEKMTQEKQPIAVLVAGGFHTEGLMDTLAKQGASVAVLTPKIGQVDLTHRYLDAFAQDPLPLEKIFNGEPISMKTECPLGESSSSGEALRAEIHVGIVLSILNKRRLELNSSGEKPRDIKRALIKSLGGLKEKVQALARMPLSVETVTPQGVSLNVGGGKEKALATAEGDATEVSVTPARPNLTSDLLASPTLRQEIQIAWKEITGFLSPAIYFWDHPQWVGYQKWIGGLLILGLWLVMGETATTVVNLLSSVDLSYGILSHSDISTTVGLLAGFFATLPAHVGWNYFAEKANAVFKHHRIPFRFPRLTVRDEIGKSDQDIQRVLVLLREWVREFNLSQNRLNELFKLVKGMDSTLLKRTIEKLNLNEQDKGKLIAKLVFSQRSALNIKDSGIVNKLSSATLKVIFAGWKDFSLPLSKASPIHFDQTSPPVNGMIVTNAYIEGLNLEQANKSPLEQAEEAYSLLKQTHPDSATELDEMMKEIRQMNLEDGLGDVALLMAGVIDRVTRAQPDRFILHFARDMGLTLVTQEIMAQMDGTSRNGGALFLNRAMMGSVYADLRNVLSQGLKYGQTQEEAVLDWIQTKANDPANDGFQKLMKATQSSLRQMGVFEQEKVLLFDTGLVGTMPWFVWAVIHYTDMENGRRSRRDVDILLVKSINGTRQIGLHDIGQNAKFGLNHSLLSLLENNDSLLSQLENTGDRGGHPIRFVPAGSNASVEESSPANQLLFRFFLAVFVKQALVFRELETTPDELFQNLMKKITPKIHDYLHSGVQVPLSGSKIDKYLIFAKPDLKKSTGEAKVNLLELWKSMEAFSSRLEKINNTFENIEVELKPLVIPEEWKKVVPGAPEKNVWKILNFFKNKFLGTIVLLPLLETVALQGLKPALENWLTFAGIDPSGGMVLFSAGLLFSLVHVLALSMRGEKVTWGDLPKDILIWTLGGTLFSLLLTLDGGFGWSLGLHSLLNHGVINNWLKDIPFFGSILKYVERPFAVGVANTTSQGPQLLTQERRRRNEAITNQSDRHGAPITDSAALETEIAELERQLTPLLRFIPGKMGFHARVLETENKRRKMWYFVGERGLDLRLIRNTLRYNVKVYGDRVGSEKRFEKGVEVKLLIDVPQQNFTLESSKREKKGAVEWVDWDGSTKREAFYSTEDYNEEVFIPPQAQFLSVKMTSSETKPFLDLDNAGEYVVGNLYVRVLRGFIDFATLASRGMKPNLGPLSEDLTTSYITPDEETSLRFIVRLDPEYPLTRQWVQRALELGAHLDGYFKPGGRDVFIKRFSLDVSNNREEAIEAEMALKGFDSIFGNVDRWRELLKKTEKSQGAHVPGALGLWDSFSFSRGWGLAQRGWAEGWGTGMMYLGWMAGAMAFGLIPLAPGLDGGSLLAFTLASLVNPSLAFGAAFLALSITLHRLSGVKLRNSETPFKDWPSGLVASSKSLSGLVGIPLIGLGVSLAAMGGVFGFPWMILGVAAGALIVRYGIIIGAESHRLVNGRVEANNLARGAVRQELAHHLGETLLGGRAEAMWFDPSSKNKVTSLVDEIKAGPVEGAIKQLSTMGRIKELLGILDGQLRDENSVFVKNVYLHAGKNWANQSNGPFNLGAHDFKEWKKNPHLTDFFKAAIQAAIQSNRPVIIAAHEGDQLEIITQLGVDAKHVFFTSVGIEGSILNARTLMAGKSGPLLVADMKTVINFDGIEVTSYPLISVAISEEIKRMALILQNA